VGASAVGNAVRSENNGPVLRPLPSARPGERFAARLARSPGSLAGISFDLFTGATRLLTVAWPRINITKSPARAVASETGIARTRDAVGASNARRATTLVALARFQFVTLRTSAGRLATGCESGSPL